MSSNTLLHGLDGDWLAESLHLPAGGYAWHRFRGRGYVALAGVTPVASVSPVSAGGWSLRIEGFRWRSLPAAAATEDGCPPDCRWFASSRAAIAEAGRLLAGAPHFRQELVGPLSRGPARAQKSESEAGTEQSALAL